MKPVYTVILLIVPLLIATGCSGGDSDCRYGPDISTENALQSYTYTTTPLNSSDLVVMSRNIYLGANISSLLAEDELLLLLQMTGELFEDIIGSEFPRRAEALAREIEQTDADVIGLQEAVIVQTGKVTFTTDGAVNADCSEYDFLSILLDALEARGLSYSTAVIAENADIELTDLTKDIRITDQDVILVKSGLSVTGALSSVFTTILEVPFSGFPTVQVKRSFSGILVDDGTNTVRIVNAHLETAVAGDVTIQGAQGSELAGYITGTLLPQGYPVIIMGDFNSGPDAASTATYDTMMAISGIADTWIASGATGDGYTCCYPSDLTGTPGDMGKRIDHIFFISSGTVTLTADGAMTTQNAAEEKIYRTDDTRIWASDHGGVAGAFSFSTE